MPSVRKSDLTIDGVRALLSKAVNGNQKAWAEANGMSSAYVSDAIAGRTTVGPKILEALGLEMVTIYRRRTRPIDRKGVES